MKGCRKLKWDNIVIGFSIIFVMINALYPVCTTIVKFVIDVRSGNKTTVDALKKENSMYRIKIQQLEENNEHLSAKLKNIE
jgi:hypothetical protein